MIAALGNAEDAEIHWCEESGLHSDDVRRGFAPKGKTPLVRIANQRL